MRSRRSSCSSSKERIIRGLIELEHRGVDRPETEEEQKLKEEINGLKELAKETVTGETKVDGLASGDPTKEKELHTLEEQIMLKEKQLELLIRLLDDQVWFGKKDGDSRPGTASRPASRPGTASRPGSASGRPYVHLERPGSRSGLSDIGLSDSFERPRSRGGEDMVDVWTRPNEDRRGMHVDRESFSDRNRLSSRERW